MERVGHNAHLTRRRFAAATLCGLAMPALAVPATAAPSSADYDALLANFVYDRGDGLNVVNYASLRATGHKQLKRFVQALETSGTAGRSNAEQAAFWINLYNAKTLDLILDYYPIASIKEIDLGGGVFGRGPWKAKLLVVDGRSLSLDNIEHDILRHRFGDPLVHYALNCASIGCPNLQRRAWRASTMTEQSQTGARAYVNHPRGLSFGSGQLTASKIYRWYKGDFGGRKGLKSHWMAYAGPTLAKQLSSDASPDAYVYDWSLNDGR